jgi:hypothetical protein
MANGRNVEKLRHAPSSPCTASTTTREQSFLPTENRRLIRRAGRRDKRRRRNGPYRGRGERADCRSARTLRAHVADPCFLLARLTSWRRCWASVETGFPARWSTGANSALTAGHTCWRLCCRHSAATAAASSAHSAALGRPRRSPRTAGSCATTPHSKASWARFPSIVVISPRAVLGARPSFTAWRNRARSLARLRWTCVITASTSGQFHARAPASSASTFTRAGRGSCRSSRRYAVCAAASRVRCSAVTCCALGVSTLRACSAARE